MAIIKCKMCGGDIELSADKSFGVCEFCGSTMTLPKVDDDQRAAAFNRGNHFRRIGEFDKALTVYEALVRDDEADAEAHWCCALCRFGIEYVKDPASGEYMPTCHRASFDSFLEDVDTKAAIEHADAVAKRQYERDAQIIEEVRRGILTLSQNEQPYDVFICYKETDDRGQRTIDSQRAQEIYYQLTDQGRRVFFARITLEDKAGQQYEPYIFAALNSAKVMIVVGTRREHLEAVWVKNEWSRFLAIMKRDRKKLLIPCYADMDPYDMPEQLSVLQSYDMTKIGFIQDLTRGIAKVLDADKKPTQEPSAQEPSMSGNVKALLKRGNMALEDGDWAKADEFFEQVLNQNAECAEAYLGKVLVEQRAASIQNLVEKRMTADPEEDEKEELITTTDEKRVKEAIDRWEIPNYLTQVAIRENYVFWESYRSAVQYWTEAKAQEEDWWSSERNLVRARKYANGAFKQELESEYKDLMDFFEKRISEATAQSESDRKALEQKFARFNDDADNKTEELYISESQRREKDYANACKVQADAKRREDTDLLEKTAKDFIAIGDYKDCKKRHDDCIKAVDAIFEKRRWEEEERLASEKRRKKKCAIISLSTVAGIAVAVVIGLFAPQYIKDLNSYRRAESLLSEGNYDEAIQVFAELGNFKDAANRVSQTKYEQAEAQLAEGKYDEAIQLFTELGDYKDAADRVSQTKYEQADALVAEGKIQAAALAFGRIKDFQDAITRSRELWQEVTVPISGGLHHTIGLKSNDTVVAVGLNSSGQCSVSKWTDIVAISAGNYHTIGLKSDGTVVAVGLNSSGQCSVSEWTDIVAISAGGSHTVGLKSDGTVVAVGLNSSGQYSVSEWTDIVAISAGGSHTVGLKFDGTVVAVGSNTSGQCDVSGWTDIAAISAGSDFTVGLKSDGTVVAVGNNNYGQCDVSDWTDIVAISAGGSHTVGLKSDGTVVAVGGNSFGQCDVSSWSDIVAISAGGSYTVGLKPDGTVVAVGGNSDGQCDVSDWTDIWIPKSSQQ